MRGINKRECSNNSFAMHQCGKFTSTNCASVYAFSQRAWVKLKTFIRVACMDAGKGREQDAEASICGIIILNYGN